MNVNVNRQKITDHIQSLEKVTGKQLNLEVLKCILLEAKKDTLVMRATNLDIGIEVSIPATVKKEGVIAVPAAVLSGFLEHSAGEHVDLSLVKDQLKVKAGRASVSINTISSEEFPTLPQAKGSHIQISANVFAQGLRSVWYAASTSSMKPELSSVLVSYSGDNLIFAATDSFRLAEKKVQADGVDEFSPLLIPFKNVGDIIRNLDRVTEDTIVEITASNNQISFSFDDTHVTSRLIDGTFPDYGQIIPSQYTTEAIVLKQDLLQALKITNVFANRFNQVSFSVDPSKKQFTITTTGGESGESSVAIEASLSGEVVDVSFNQKYITDSFQSIGADSVTLRLSGNTKPMVIKGVNEPTFLYLTMPMSR